MKSWRIPVIWQEAGTVVVEANTLEEAIEIARDDDGVIPIPDDGYFVDDSWEVDCDDKDYLREWYNDNQEDEEDQVMRDNLFRELKVKDEIEKVLRQMCFGRSREWSEGMVNRILKTNVINDKCIMDSIVVDEDMIISALMEIVF